MAQTGGSIIQSGTMKIRIQPGIMMFHTGNPYEAFSFVMVPKKPWAPKRKIVSSAQGSLLRQPFKEQMGKPHIGIPILFLKGKYREKYRDSYPF